MPTPSAKASAESFAGACCDALLVEDPIDFYYLTGLDVSAGKVLVHCQGAHILVDARYAELCRKNAPFPVVDEGNDNLEKLLADPEFPSIRKLAFNAR